jgi:hypothetical protein
VIHRPASESSRPDEGDQAAIASPAADQDDP